MLNLWSQVGRVGCSCRCPSCLTAKHALVRRVSTAIGRIRARPKASSTFVYSAIFAAATVTDGHFKQQRRAHWDDAIRNARQELEAKQQAVKDNPEHKLRYESHVEADSEGAAETEAEPEADFEIRYIQQSFNDQHKALLSVDNITKFAPNPGGTRPPLPQTTQPVFPSPKWRGEGMPPQSLWSGEIRRTKAAAFRWSEKKIGIAELSAVRLVVDLLLLIDLDSQSMINLVVLPEALHEIARRSRAEQQALRFDLETDIRAVTRLKPWQRRGAGSADITIPHYSQREDGSHLPIVEELNESIVGLIQACKRKEINFRALVIKICNNLLVSPVPPDLQTCNILLLGFYDLDNHTEKRHLVVDAVLHWCRTAKFRPNEVTCAALLSSFVKRDLPNEFAEFIALMRAADGKALMLAKPDIGNLEPSQGRLVRHPQDPSKILQAVHPSALVFWQIVRGILKFSGIEDAINICKEFDRNAWGLDRTCILALLMRCVNEEDWKSGSWVWEQVQIFATRHGKVDMGRIVGAMLALCLRCDEQDKFREVFRDALDQKFGYEDGEVKRRRKYTPLVLVDLTERALKMASRHDMRAGSEEDGEEGDLVLELSDSARAREKGALRALGHDVKRLNLQQDVSDDGMMQDASSADERNLKDIGTTQEERLTFGDSDKGIADPEQTLFADWVGDGPLESGHRTQKQDQAELKVDKSQP